MREHKNLPASFNDRNSAFFLDLGAVSLALLINIFMQYETLYKVLVTIIVWFIINIVPAFFYKGQTLGKNLSHIKVVDDQFHDVSMTRYIIRSLFIFIVGFITVGIYFVVGLYIAEKRIDKKSIHDLLFKTKVVRTKVFVQLSE